MPNNSPLSRIRKGRLVQVLAVYLGASWLVLQVARVLQEALALPAWVSPVAVLLLLVGLVVVLATAWVQSHPLAVERVEAEEVPGKWELAARELKSSVMAGRMPHLTWARALLGGVAAFWLLFGFAGLYVVVKDRGESFLPAAAYAGEAGPGVAVVPFEVSGADLDLWREGMVDLLTRNLDGVGGLRAIASRTMLARWREAVPDGQTPDLATVLDVARRTDATYAVVGSAVAIGPRVRLGATVHELSTGRELARGAVEGALDQVLNLVDELSVQLLRALLAGGAGQAVPPGRLGSITTTSIPALRSFLEGESRFRAGAFRDAIEAYERAVATDSTFALAHYRLGEAHSWLGNFAAPETREHTSIALRFADRLSARDAAMVGAAHALAHGRIDGLDVLRQLVVRYPDDADAWYRLGDLILHLGARALATTDEAARAFFRAVELDPGHAPSYIHAVEMAIALNDAGRARELVEAYERLTGRGSGRLRAALDFIYGDAAAREQVLVNIADAPTAALLSAAAQTPAPTSLSFRDALLAELYHRDPGEHRSILRAQHVSRGRLADAVALLDRSDVDWAFLVDVSMIPALGGRLPSQLLDRAFSAVPADSTTWQLFAGAHAADRADWAAFDSARRTLRQAADRLHAAGDSTGAALHGALDRTLEGYGLWRRGRTDEAARLFQQVQRENRSPDLARAELLARWWAGFALAESTSPADALPYLRSLERHWRSSHGFYVQGQVYERIGQPDSARTAYATFLDAWADADPDLPLLLDARERLRRLTTER